MSSLAGSGEAEETHCAGINQATLQVGSHSFFLESEHPLTGSPEIAASAFYLPAMSAGSQIEFEPALDPKFLANLDRVGEIAHSWWGWPYSAHRVVAGTKEEPRSPGASTAMFFTAGVDSFCTLRRNLDQMDTLICVHGFDVKLREKERFAKIKIRLSLIASELGLDLILIKTDLRDQSIGHTNGLLREDFLTDFDN